MTEITINENAAVLGMFVTFAFAVLSFCLGYFVGKAKE